MTRRADLGLGTAQFGREPTSLSPHARVGEEQVRAILDTAAASHLTLIDTAPRYGEAERLLGQSWPFPSPFKVITKTLRLSEGLDRIEARARRSLERMGLPRGHALMVEHGEDLLAPEGRQLWARLEKLRDEGLFQKIGISIHGDDEPLLLARRFCPDIVQVPCSLLDQRFCDNGALRALKDLGCEVQLRSVFLQGLLFLPREALPAALGDAGPRLSRIRRILAEAGADPMQAALAFAQTRPEASSVIVGVASAAELRALIAASHAPVPDLDWKALSLDCPVALDPRQWPSAPDGLSSAA